MNSPLVACMLHATVCTSLEDSLGVTPWLHRNKISFPHHKPHFSSSDLQRTRDDLHHFKMHSFSFLSQEANISYLSHGPLIELSLLTHALRILL
ncbi:hypothetical protein IQ07DRAFT_585448 [Pyrenochaeta sp. DS3sAY3a]|nr:hypothetical protein IQ07DRAFT_585448 [Pyrenochaeta sp. DS3sAY3a]